LEIDFEIRKKIRIENLRDILVSVFVAIPFQVSLFCFLMSLVVSQWIQFFVFFIIFCFCSILLYFFWWKYLENREEEPIIEDK